MLDQRTFDICLRWSDKMSLRRHKYSRYLRNHFISEFIGCKVVEVCTPWKYFKEFVYIWISFSFVYFLYRQVIYWSGVKKTRTLRTMSRLFFSALLSCCLISVKVVSSTKIISKINIVPQICEEAKQVGYIYFFTEYIFFTIGKNVLQIRINWNGLYHATMELRPVNINDQLDSRTPHESVAAILGGPT